MPRPRPAARRARGPPRPARGCRRPRRNRWAIPPMPRSRRVSRERRIEALGRQAVGDAELGVELGRHECGSETRQHERVDRARVRVALHHHLLAVVRERQAAGQVALRGAVDQKPRAPRAPRLGGERCACSNGVGSHRSRCRSVSAGMSSPSARSPSASSRPRPRRPGRPCGRARAAALVSCRVAQQRIQIRSLCLGLALLLVGRQPLLRLVLGDVGVHRPTSWRCDLSRRLSMELSVDRTHAEGPGTRCARCRRQRQ